MSEPTKDVPKLPEHFAVGINKRGVFVRNENDGSIETYWPESEVLRLRAENQTNAADADHWRSIAQGQGDELARLRAELAKASAEAAKPAPFSQCNDGWGYAISSIGWDDLAVAVGLDCPSRISVTRTDNNGRTQVLDFVEPNRFLAGKKPHQFTGAEALAPSYEASQAAKVEEWNTTTDDCQVSTERLAELRASYAAGAAKESMSEPTRSRCRDAVRALDELLEVRATKDAPPADVLGEAFRRNLQRALRDGEVPESIYSAVRSLSEVVERIARAQRAGGAK